MTETIPLKKILITEQQIDARTQQLAEQISKDYAGKDLVLVGILRGSVIFYANLVKRIKINCKLDFMSLSSYSGTNSSGKVRMMLDCKEDICGRHVIVVEDITDTGITAAYLTQLLTTRGPASIEICTLLDKPGNRSSAIAPKYIGFKIENEFVIGYGLDYNGLYRNLPYIGVFDETQQ
ncbi:MAG: hypoxanthine phosphoribosyltransferase [Elusimicrobiota bacterium]|jgi:hypoxanthine phosphoribosyltransferase|nr:hypoxanthine phosphoribosyltransferase [Elusimicrobiota bacterium]